MECSGQCHIATETMWHGTAGGVLASCEELKVQASQALADLASCHMQGSIDGDSNIWILKPGGKSRGRGISCTNRWADIKVSCYKPGKDYALWPCT